MVAADQEHMAYNIHARKPVACVPHAAAYRKASPSMVPTDATGRPYGSPNGRASAGHSVLKGCGQPLPPSVERRLSLPKLADSSPCVEQPQYARFRRNPLRIAPLVSPSLLPVASQRAVPPFPPAMHRAYTVLPHRGSFPLQQTSPMPQRTVFAASPSQAHRMIFTASPPQTHRVISSGASPLVIPRMLSTGASPAQPRRLMLDAVSPSGRGLTPAPVFAASFTYGAAVNSPRQLTPACAVAQQTPRRGRRPPPTTRVVPARKPPVARPAVKMAPHSSDHRTATSVGSRRMNVLASMREEDEESSADDVKSLAATVVAEENDEIRALRHDSRAQLALRRPSVVQEKQQCGGAAPIPFTPTNLLRRQDAEQILFTPTNLLRRMDAELATTPAKHFRRSASFCGPSGISGKNNAGRSISSSRAEMQARTLAVLSWEGAY
eukprot:GEMP01037638.1.p1 GENE.GEMP01037638.1~~GEMP01037638.1.p1  ORF type:complete len:437 (+),score=102.43 GEMP01037638.1:240-1550(+)